MGAPSLEGLHLKSEKKAECREVLAPYEHLTRTSGRLPLVREATWEETE